MTVAEALAGVTKLGLDTSPFIYYVEADFAYLPVCREVFRILAATEMVGITSALTLTEVLVHPLRTEDPELVAAYSNLLLATEGIVTLGIDPAVARKAADIRAKYGLRTPDAIQLAAAIGAGCEAFLTNDKNLKRVADIGVWVVDDLTV